MKKSTRKELKQRIRKLEQAEHEQEEVTAESRLRFIELGEENQEMDRLVSRILHEFQEPLDTVKRYLQFVDARYKDRLDPDAASFIESAVDATNKIEALVGELLAYLRRRSPSGAPWGSSQ